MGKQKAVIRVSMHDQKSRSKAMKIAVGLSGVNSVTLKGEGMNEIEVIGEGVDSVTLCSLLRKSFGHAELLSVGPEEEKKEDKKEDKKDGPIIHHVDWVCSDPKCPICDIRCTSEFQDPYCSIM
ncbi:hypothetical protein Fmac_020605 [Flemingia macrophylla]|uniref:Uncharacterized protein n=1 Tax=Flemingia macrophylla TaxID=520843 RepID=A0ABD1LUG7_9FABA